jgi:hypothetical protein
VVGISASAPGCHRVTVTGVADLIVRAVATGRRVVITHLIGITRTVVVEVADPAFAGRGQLLIRQRRGS